MPTAYAPPRSHAWGSPTFLDRDTWLEPECDGSRRARVIFPDGKARIVRCRGTADTWFSVAMIGTVQTPEGRRHAYVTADNLTDPGSTVRLPGQEVAYFLRICNY